MCTFKDNEILFEVDGAGFTKDCYHDTDEKFSRYWVEDNSDSLKWQMLPQRNLIQKYERKCMEWDFTNGQGQHDFKPLVKQILSTDKSITMYGRAGTGKSTCISKPTSRDGRVTD